jgi:hypothetical protein
MSTAAKVVCRQLANRAAAHSTTYASVPRKFAVVLPDPSINGGQVAGLSDLTAQLNQCGLRDIPIVYYNDQDSGNASLSASYINLKNSGVTTLIFYPFWGGAREYGPQAVADSAAYYPEWFTIGWGRWVSANLAAGPQSETVNTFGVGDWNKSGPLASQPWYQAFTDGGGTADQGTVLNPGDGFYHELLMLASGAQMAGPHLTAATLSAALESTVFPNPGAAGPPYYQGRVGFGDGSKVMVNDYVGFWLDPSATQAVVVQDALAQADSGYRELCFVDHGTRYAPSAIPPSDQYQRGQCR